MFEISDLPTVNASLNATSLVFLTLGFVFIKRGNRRVHKVCMIAALTASTLFLTSYVIYHLNAEPTRFAGPGWLRPVYFTILITHVVLAATIAPLVIMTVLRAVKGSRSGDYGRHRALARWTWPLWTYVSVTGIIVYLLLYQVYAP